MPQMARAVSTTLAVTFHNAVSILQYRLTAAVFVMPLLNCMPQRWHDDQGENFDREGD